jgi:nucleoid-associated protein YgaU
MAKRGRRKTSVDQNFFSNRSYKNLFYGAATVVVLFIAGFLILKVIQNVCTIGEPGIDTEREDGKTYVVQEGDTLWSISQKVYNDPYKWERIASANRIQNPDILEKGTELTIPELAEEIALEISPSPTHIPTDVPRAGQTTVKSDAPATSKGALSGQATETPSMAKITGNSYTVVEGDNLWNIAVRRYADGYRWVDIARLNKLQNPDLIYPGDKFTLPK